MATTDGNVLIGAATVSIGAWVSAGGAGSLTDVGHTKDPSTIGVAHENYEQPSESQMGPVKIVPTKMGITVKIPILECTPDLLAIAMRQATANVTGTAPNKTVLIGDPVEQYHQIMLVSKGPGSTTQGTRTITIWKAQVTNVGEWAHGKAVPQAPDITLTLLKDNTVTTNGKYFKIVDSGGV